MLVGEPALSDTKLVFPVGYPFANEDVIQVLHKLAGLTDSVVEAFTALCLNDGVDLDAAPSQLRPLPLFGGGEIRLVERTDPDGAEIPPIGVVVQQPTRAPKG